MGGSSDDLLYRPAAGSLTGEVEWTLTGGDVDAFCTHDWADTADPLVVADCG